MNRRVSVPICVLLVGAAVLLVIANSCGGGKNSSSTVSATPKIEHVVVIFQENRTPDNLFQDPVLIARGADIASSGVNSAGQTIALTPLNLGSNGSNPDTYDIDHSHKAFLAMCDLNAGTQKCAMDGADRLRVICPKGATGCPPANAQFRYVNPADVAAYFQMAEKYSFADRMFQTNQGPSFPAHLFLLSGTSETSVGGSEMVSENPAGVANAMSDAGCIAPPTEYVAQIDPSGVVSTIYPCVEEKTVTDLLDAAGLSWKYYAPTAGYIWTSPTAIQHMCGPNAAPPNATACVGADYVGASPKVVVNQTQSNAQILTDIAHGQLAQVSWVIPAAQFSDHAHLNTGCGPSWVTQVVNAIGSSQYWSNTAIIITWDDWGGWYDHVSPSSIVSSYEYGFRVPMIVIAPYGKTQYISHTNHDFGSILKFVESTFGLPSLGRVDAKADDLSDFFDFTKSATTFQAITPPSNTAACISDTSPPGAPDDD